MNPECSTCKHDRPEHPICNHPMSAMFVIYRIPGSDIPPERCAGFESGGPDEIDDLVDDIKGCYTFSVGENCMGQSVSKVNFDKEKAREHIEKFMHDFLKGGKDAQG